MIGWARYTEKAAPGDKDTAAGQGTPIGKRTEADHSVYNTDLPG